MKCRHYEGKDSTLRVLQVRSILHPNKSMYCVECEVCHRRTDWFYSIRKAKIEAWYECWVEEDIR